MAARSKSNGQSRVTRTGVVALVSRWLLTRLSPRRLNPVAWLCFLSPGRPGELHPEPPTDPDMNLSIHPARAPLKKAGAFRQNKEFLRFPR